MPKYTDGYVLPVLRRNLKAYFRVAKITGRVWRDHGALDYKECLGDDLKTSFALAFPKGIRAKPGETVVFSFIVFKSRAHRDKVNAAAMKDPRLAALCNPKKMPFDFRRMLHGGFKVMVDA